MKVTPLKGDVLVRVLEESMSDGGIHLLDSGHKDGPGQNRTGIVVRLGPWLTTKNGHAIVPEVAPGNKVVFSQHAGRALEGEHRGLRLLKQEEILGILTPTE